MTQDALLVQRRGAVRVLVNNNPRARNALTPQYYESLRRELQEVSDDAATSAVILTGAGGFFCAGGDMHQLIRRREMPRAERRQRIEVLHDVIRSIRQCPKPVIASVEGGAAGAGASIALACDLIVMARDARLSLAYVKIGLSPDGGATAFLAQCLPRHLLTELCMLGDRIDAQRLAAMGVVNRIVDPGQCDATALELAQQLAQGPERALARIKTLAQSAYDNTLANQLDAEADRMADSLGDDEATEGISAFLEKRPTRFGHSAAEGTAQ